MPKETDWLEKMIATLKERAKTLTELVDQAHYYLSDDISIDEKAWKKILQRRHCGAPEQLNTRAWQA